MRIIGEIPHSIFKITVFSMNERVSVKLEHQLLEQTYKFRDGSGVHSVGDVQRFLSDRFLERAEELFTSMAKNKMDALLAFDQELEEFDDII